jgi:hypothetical protein
MKKITIGILTAAALFTAGPAMAQVGFYAGPGGVGVGVGAPGPYYRDGYYRDQGYYDYDRGPGVDVRIDHGRHHGWRHDYDRGW